MNTTLVTDIMTAAGALPSIGLDTNLLDAAQALKQSAAVAPTPLLVSVKGQDGTILGILGMVDLLRGLNPKYAQAGFFTDMAEQGVGPDMLQMLMEDYTLTHETMEAISLAASTNTVKDLIAPPHKNEHIPAEATLDAAIDLMVLRRRDYLLVTEGEKTVGVIDAASVYDALIELARASKHLPEEIQGAGI